MKITKTKPKQKLNAKKYGATEILTRQTLTGISAKSHSGQALFSARRQRAEYICKVLNARMQITEARLMSPSKKREAVKLLKQTFKNSLGIRRMSKTNFFQIIYA